MLNGGLNLEKMSSNQVALRLWQQPFMKKKILKYYTDQMNSSEDLFSSLLRNKAEQIWTNELLDQINKEDFHFIIKNSLVTSIQNIAIELSSYMGIVTYNLKKSDSYLSADKFRSLEHHFDNICILNDGEIDVKKSMTSVYCDQSDAIKSYMIHNHFQAMKSWLKIKDRLSRQIERR